MSSTTLVFMSFSAEIIYSFKILFQVEIVWILKFESFKQSHMTNLTKIKVVHVDELYNFYVYDIFILGHLMS